MRAETTPPGSGATRIVRFGFDRLALSDIRTRLPDGRSGAEDAWSDERGAGAGAGDDPSFDDDELELPLDPELGELGLGAGSFLGTACCAAAPAGTARASATTTERAMKVDLAMGRAPEVRELDLLPDKRSATLLPGRLPVNP